MTDRPIIFSAPMVRTLLEGRKTQTRRVIKPQPFHTIDGYGCIDRSGAAQKWIPQLPGLSRYVPGDRLWVRESHALVPTSSYRFSEGVSQTIDPSDAYRSAIYRAGFDRCTGGILWRPSIHMPRWASRLTLIVTDVRVQRLQEISGEDCAAEGVCEFALMPPTDADAAEARSMFRDLWNSLHGPDAWDENPWVAAITFSTIHANIDSAEAAA